MREGSRRTESAEELALLVPGVLLALDIDLLVVLDHSAGLAHLFHTRTYLHCKW